MSTQIDTTTQSADATATPAGTPVVVIPSDASIAVQYFGSTGPILATAQAPYTTWAKQAIGAASTHNSQSLTGHSGDDNLQAIVTSPTNGEYFFTFARSGNAWSQTGVGATGDAYSATSTGPGVSMWTGLDPQGRFWYVGIDDFGSPSNFIACGYRSGTTWTMDATMDGVALTELNERGVCAAIIGSFLVIVYDSGAGHLTYRRLDVSQATLGSWSAATQVGTLADVAAASVLSLRAIPGGSTGMLAYSGTSGISALTYDAVGDAWGAAHSLSATTSDVHPCLIAGATGVVYAVWAQFASANSYALVGAVYSGGAWSASPTTLEAAGTNIQWPHGAYLSAAGQLALIWTAGAASPWSIQFASVAAPISGSLGESDGVGAATASVTLATAGVSAGSGVASSAVSSAASPGYVSDLCATVRDLLGVTTNEVSDSQIQGFAYLPSALARVRARLLSDAGLVFDTLVAGGGDASAHALAALSYLTAALLCPRMTVMVVDSEQFKDYKYQRNRQMDWTATQAELLSQYELSISYAAGESAASALALMTGVALAGPTRAGYDTSGGLVNVNQGVMNEAGTPPLPNNLPIPGQGILE